MLYITDIKTLAIGFQVTLKDKRNPASAIVGLPALPLSWNVFNVWLHVLLYCHCQVLYLKKQSLISVELNGIEIHVSFKNNQTYNMSQGGNKKKKYIYQL